MSLRGDLPPTRHAPLLSPSRGTRRAKPSQPSDPPQREAAVFLSLRLLNPKNQELESYSTFKNHSELHLFAKP